MTTHFTLSHLRRISLLVLFFTASFSLKAQPTVLTSDSLALVALYNSTNGPGWTNKTNWLAGPVNTWFGVTVSANRVFGLDLGVGNLGNNLVGPIPPQIGNLTGLNFLTLSFNQLSGTIPSELFSLTNLFHLDLGVNQMTGPLPAGIGNLTNLIGLYLGGNQLIGSLPTQIGNLVNLTNGDISGNPFSGSIPAEFGNLVLLENFAMAYCGFSGAVPATITNLSALQSFNIEGNSFDQLPDLSSLTNLTSLKLRGNYFTFEDIVPNVGITGVSYDPQNLFGISAPINLRIGETLNLSYPYANHPGTSYQWKKDGLDLPGEAGQALSIPGVVAGDLGLYSVEVTNSATPGFFISSDVVQVSVFSESLFEWADGGDLTQEGYFPTPSGILSTDQNYGGQWGDFNNDGFEDVFVVGVANEERSYLYKNNGDGTFSKLPNNAYFFSEGRSVTWADYNNDGLLDCFAPGGASGLDSTAFASVFKNNGDETFTQIPLPTGATAGSWADTDNDGDLDLIINAGPAGNLIRLFRYDGNDVFAELSAFPGATFGQWNPIALDINNDGIMDVYNPGGGTTFRQTLHIGNGDNTFTLATAPPFATDVLNSPRGASWADIDNDGDIDAFVMSSFAGGTDHRFYINDGAGNFTMQSSLAVLGETIFGGRGSAFQDYDNDGFVDLLTYSNLPENGWYLFRNNGNGSFSKQVGQNFKGASGLIGASFGDYDNDGFMDIVSASFGSDFNGLYHNKGNSNNWVQLKLVGNLSNRSAIGAKVDVYSPGLRTHQQIIASNGFGNQNSLVAQFGLGANTAIDSVVIRWPSGVIQMITDLPINQKNIINEGNYEADSLALVTFYNSTGGVDWTNKENWLVGDVTTWAGVTFNGTKVTAINLPSNNLTGSVPTEINNLDQLKKLNLSGNKLIALPDMTTLTELTSVNVSNNKINFGSLESNVSITGIEYANQAVLGDSTGVLVAVGTNPIVNTDGGGTADQYQWKYNGANIAGANQSTYTITAIDRSNMGDYTCVITNPTVPGLTLKSAVQTVLATATLSGRLLIDATTPATAGTMTLFKVQPMAFDTIAVKAINADGTFSLENILLNDYQLMGYADTLAHIDALPTYYEDTPFWEEADTLLVNSNLPTLDIVSQFKPVPSSGGGVVSGTLTEPEGGSTGGRTRASKGIKNAGVSLRRKDGSVLTLIAYKFTNPSGEFLFDKLDPGNYKLNIQYPGYPMDPNSFIDISLGSGPFDKQVSVDAQVKDGMIVVKKRIITGFAETETYYTIYPNPSTERINIKRKTGNSQNLRIQMIESTGRALNVPVHYNESEDVWSLDVHTLSFGHYFINVEEKGKREVAKVAIVR